MVNFTRPTQPPSGSATWVGNGGSATAMNIAGQLATQLAGVASISLSGNSIFLQSDIGVPESRFDTLTLALPSNGSVPAITYSSIGVIKSGAANANLGRAAGAATALLNQQMAIKGGASQAEALAAGRPNYTVTLGPLSTVDRATAIFTGTETEGFQKTVKAMTLDAGSGAVVAGYNPFPPIVAGTNSGAAVDWAGAGVGECGEGCM